MSFLRALKLSFQPQPFAIKRLGSTWFFISLFSVISFAGLSSLKPLNDD